MSVAVGWSFAIFALLLAKWSIFAALLDATNGQTDALRVSNELHEERLGILISIPSVAKSGDSGDAFTAEVQNASKGVSFGDFSKLDLITRYTNSTGDIVSKRLAFSSDWSVSNITGDVVNPAVWDPGETATISFTIDPPLKTGTKGTVALTLPQGISDSAYFEVVP